MAVQLPPDGSGKVVDTVIVGPAHRQIVVIGDPNNVNNLMQVTSGGGLSLQLVDTSGSTDIPIMRRLLEQLLLEIQTLNSHFLTGPDGDARQAQALDTVQTFQ